VTALADVRLATQIALDKISGELIDGSDAFTINDDMVTDTARRLDQSGVVTTVEGWAEQDAKGPGGAPEKFPKRALLVVMFLCARLGLPMLVTVWMAVIRSLTPAARRSLGLPDVPPRSQRNGRRAYYRNLRTRFHATERLMDFSYLPKNRRLKAEDFDRYVAERLRELTPERVEVLRARQEWFINRILRISHRAVPPELWKLWRGGAAVDATPVETFAKGPKREPKSKKRKDRKILIWSADGQGGWYVREGDHGDVNWLEDGSEPTKVMYGYEHTHVFMAASTKDERGLFPKLLLAMPAPHIPGESPGRNGFRGLELAIEAASEAGKAIHLVAANNAYVNADAEQFAIPLRNLGIDLVIDYNARQLGKRGSHDGALMVEGWWYCPAMPEDLINATEDLHAGRIDWKTYQRRLADRAPFEFRQKAAPKADGSVRLMCPAAGVAPTARCVHKRLSQSRRHLGKRRVDLNHLLAKNPPKACRQQTITVPATARGRFEQPFRYGTEAWRLPYQTMRSTNEGGNGINKDAARQNLQSAQRRRIRGQAANALMTCFMLCAENLRLIGSWASKAEPDDQGIERIPYAKRKLSENHLRRSSFDVPTTGPPELVS
jgi:hypothetical protein